MEDDVIDETLIPRHSTSYTARRLGISIDGLKAVVNRGEIEAHKRGSWMKFTSAEIERYERDMIFKPEDNEEVLMHIKKLDVKPIQI